MCVFFRFYFSSDNVRVLDCTRWGSILCNLFSSFYNYSCISHSHLPVWRVRRKPRRARKNSYYATSDVYKYIPLTFMWHFKLLVTVCTLWFHGASIKAHLFAYFTTTRSPGVRRLLLPFVFALIFPALSLSLPFLSPSRPWFFVNFHRVQVLRPVGDNG